MRVQTDQIAEWYRASASGSLDLGFDSESGQNRCSFLPCLTFII